MRAKIELAKKKMKELRERERELGRKEKELAKKTKEPEKSEKIQALKGDIEKKKEFTKWWESLSKDRQERYLKRHPKSKLESIYNEVKKQQAEERVKEQPKVQFDVAKQIEKKYDSTMKAVKQNASKLKGSMSFLKDPEEPSIASAQETKNNVD